jgi:hypothetical protein
LESGGVDGKVPNEVEDKEFGSIKGFHIFPFLASAGQVKQITETPWLFGPIFSSDQITEPGRNAVHKFGKIDISANDRLSAPRTLTDVLRGQNTGSQLAGAEEMGKRVSMN